MSDNSSEALRPAASRRGRRARRARAACRTLSLAGVGFAAIVYILLMRLLCRI